MKFIKRLFKNWFDKICYHNITEKAELYHSSFCNWIDVKLIKYYNRLGIVRLIQFNDKKDYIDFPVNSLSYFLRKKEKKWFKKLKALWFKWFIENKFVNEYGFLLKNIRIKQDYILSSFFVKNKNEKIHEPIENWLFNNIDNFESSKKDFYREQFKSRGWVIYSYGNFNDFCYELYREVKRLESLGLEIKELVD